MPRRGPHHDNITWRPHLRVAWGGSIGTTKEIWTNSLKFWYPAEDFVPTEAQLLAADAGVWAALKTWMTGGAGSFIGQDATLAWLKMNPINAEGLQVRQSTHIYDTQAPQGGANANAVPYYQTFALTLRTANKRGRGHAGRIFPPLAEPLIVLGTGMCSVANATSMADTFKTCMSSMTTAIRTATQVGSFAVLSPGDSLKGTFPLANLITNVVADRVPDVQHRRTNRLPRSEGASSPVPQ